MHLTRYQCIVPLWHLYLSFWNLISRNPFSSLLGSSSWSWYCACLITENFLYLDSYVIRGRHLVYTNFCPSTQILIHIKGGSSQIPTHNWKGLSDRHIKQSNTSEIRSNNPQSKAKYSRICCLLVTKQLLNIFQRFSASSLTNFGKSSNYFFLWSTWKHDFDFQNCLRLVNYI